VCRRTGSGLLLRRRWATAVWRRLEPVVRTRAGGLAAGAVEHGPGLTAAPRTGWSIPPRHKPPGRMALLPVRRPAPTAASRRNLLEVPPGVPPGRPVSIPPCGHRPAGPDPLNATAQPTPGVGSGPALVAHPAASPAPTAWTPHRCMPPAAACPPQHRHPPVPCPPYREVAGLVRGAGATACVRVGQRQRRGRWPCRVDVDEADGVDVDHRQANGHRGCVPRPSRLRAKVRVAVHIAVHIGCPHSHSRVFAVAVAGRAVGGAGAVASMPASPLSCTVPASVLRLSLPRRTVADRLRRG
jgi:hypothetical protein